MTRKDDLSNSAAGRREPSLADLEAFERLLRDSLKADAVPTEPAMKEPPKPAITAEDALAEFNRMVEAPLTFDTAGKPASPSQISAIERALQSDPATPIGPVPPLPRDPLLDFEEELRRFEAMSRPTPPPIASEAATLRPSYPGEAATNGWSEAQPAADWQGGYVEPAPAPDTGSQALDAADRRLSAEAEAAAIAGGVAIAAGAGAGTMKGRSRGVFFTLGGVALAGLAVIGGMSLFSGKTNVASGGNVPVIAAKTEPTKERPANPGGLEVPDQNKQVLAPRSAPAGQSPAQVVNQTEQPVDLNQQVNRRESVRIITPSPFQGSGDGASAQSNVATPNPPVAVPSAPASTTAGPAPTEPRRVQSVRLSDPVAPPAQPTPSIPAAGSVAAGAVAGVVPPSRPQGATTTAPVLTPGAQAAIRPQVPTPAPAATAQPSSPAPAEPAPPAPPKVEARPQSPVTAAARPQQPAAQPPRAAQGAPLSLSRPRTEEATAPAPRVANSTAGNGAFAIQLASRPTEADARAASGQLAQRYAGPIGGRTTTVVRGEANGRTVYRVRTLGFSQAEANAACDRIRAAGGGCFVTRQ